MAEHVKAWQCIGCGSIEAPQTCIGVCEHHKVEFVYADEHEAIVQDLERARLAISGLASLVRQLARTTPHGDSWERSYLALQAQARRLIADLEEEHVSPAPATTGAPTRESERTAAPA